MSGEGIIPSATDFEARNGLRRIRSGTVLCPVCNEIARIHGSEAVTPFVKTMWCRCSNLKCGMTWRMQLLFERVISPSAIEHNVELPGARATGPPGDSKAA